MKKYLIKARNEILPACGFGLTRRELNERCESGYILQRAEYKNYCTLPEDVLKECLEKEHGRGAAIDEKTYKFTSSFTAILSALALTTGFFARQNGEISEWNIFALVVFALYILMSIYLAVGALMTVPAYGYGTHFEIHLHQGQNNLVSLSENLACQETMNLIRHNRNAAVYSSLRNAIFALAVLFVFLVAEYYGLHTWICGMIFQNG